MALVRDQQVVLMECYDLLYLALMKQDGVQQLQPVQAHLQLIATWDDPGKGAIMWEQPEKKRLMERGEEETLSLLCS